MAIHIWILAAGVSVGKEKIPVTDPSTKGHLLFISWEVVANSGFSTVCQPIIWPKSPGKWRKLNRVGGGRGCSSKLCLCSSDTGRGRCIVIVKISKWLHKRIDCPWNKSKIKETEANCSKNVCVYFQRLVESAEKAHEQHEHDKDLSVGFYPVCLEINGIVIIFKIMIMVL